jgi:hypothetical protein
MKTELLSLGDEPEVVRSAPSPMIKRIRLASLDEFASERRGYDPYDTSKGLSADIWSAKRKRA